MYEASCKLQAASPLLALGEFRGRRREKKERRRKKKRESKIKRQGGGSPLAYAERRFAAGLVASHRLRARSSNPANSIGFDPCATRRFEGVAE